MMARVAEGQRSATAGGDDPRLRPIGVFDSGIGGLTVLHELLVALPQEDFVYLGDTERFPYGERSQRELARFAAEFGEEAIATVREACVPLYDAGVDTVILGCTHYPLIRPMLQRLLGPEVQLISSGAALARQVEHALSTSDLANRRTGEGDYSFLCTGDSETFQALGTRFLQMPLGAVQRVQLAAAEAAACWPAA